MQLVTPGLVLREVKVGESDRILTILTPEHGLISASAKGSLRLKSKLFSACGLFCYSEFTLFAGKSMYMVDDAQVKQVFFGLPKSLEGMALAMNLAEIAQTLLPSGGEAAALAALRFGEWAALLAAGAVGERKRRLRLGAALAACGALLAFATGVLLLAGEFIGLLVGGGLLRFLVFHVIPRLSGKRISC